MEYPDFHFTYNQLEQQYLQQYKISYSEIRDGFFHALSCWYDETSHPEFDNLYHFISFCSKYRFLRVYLTYKEDTIIFLAVKLADEEEIRKFYCGK